ncbi:MULTISPECIES: hypothetical protein [unclassified Curtobacterium]|uniref:hypothetical protein n=1 Tax=unclassified Curtobacterium TaxID=257496 RepID=UPI0008267816|nr:MULTISPECIES: hypothetical protein [unclassified Curtobacterium]WIA97445.1 hypothetical protein QOL16_03355 [Curtobacterium sp. MCBA15_004]
MSRGPSFLRPVLAVTVVALTGLSLTGCGAHDSTGQITVTVSADAAQHPYEVQVYAATGKLSEHQRVFPGGTADFAGVPLGAVTVRARDLCPVETTVSNDDVATVTLATTGC